MVDAHGVRRRKRPRSLITVANRLPVQRAKRPGAGPRWNVSPGGLVSALLPLLKRTGGSWVGWTGTSGAQGRSFLHEGIRIRPIGLSASEIEGFYGGFSNRTIWPLYHDGIVAPVFRRSWWKSYVEVNRRYARTVANLARPRDLVWVHDYQLQLVPQFLRQIRSDLRIGLFLHIPFPPVNLFAWLPWRREIVEGVLGADVVGFQTQSDANSFRGAARRFAAAEPSEAGIEFDGRTVRVGAYPISIETATFEQIAADPKVQAAAREIRRRVGSHRRILLSVDRLDYTKGIESRLLAFEELLGRRQASAENCVFIQIAVPSRETVSEYRQIRTRIERIVGRINGDYSVPGFVAVHYFRRSFGRRELAAYYLAADIMVVTPLRDGMNLVAKEYVATRLDNSGVLILSEFAGAANELRRALIVNPHDTDGMVRALRTALRMANEESRKRMSILRMNVRRHDVHFWADTFLKAMRE
ncbi:MAG: trehalose-6-phosphate synthase [Phycisphaerae bacterium]|nr:trehalose-6-phosphate synthase [Phycisphaerae bacterium]